MSLAHLALPGAPQAKHLHHLHARLTGAELPQAKKKKNVLCLFAQGHFGHVQLFGTLKTVACQAPLSGRGALQERILEGIAPSLVLPEPLRPKQLHHLHADPHRGKAKSSRAASGANPSGRPTCRGGNKTTIETQGQRG